MVDRDRKVFVFGAGASHGARAPHPPLGRDLHHYVQKYLCTAWDELHHLEEDGWPPKETVRQELRRRLNSGVPFESLIGQLIRMREEWHLLQKLNLLMAYALTPPLNGDPRADDAFVEKRDVYDRFLAIACPNLGALQNITFITFNYDCLLERAICRQLSAAPLEGERQCLCKHMNYRLTDNSTGIEVLKPHGSINSVPDILGGGDGRIAENEEIPLTATLGPGGVLDWKIINVVASPIGQGHEEIVMAHYAPGKKAQANYGTLRKVRDIAQERVCKADSITVIGLHLPSDPREDPFLSALLGSMRHVTERGRSRVRYVNRDCQEVKHAKAELDFDAQVNTFEGYVEELERTRRSSTG